jgi:hypothetical protein
MIRISRFAVLLSAAAALAACQPKDEPAAEDAAPGDTAEAPAAAPALALIDACKVKMTQPEALEWDTKWDPAHTRTSGQNPSGVRSFHWANAEEQKIAQDNGAVIPFEIVCGSDDSVEPRILLNIVAFDSSPTDVPMAPGEYPIAAKASPNKNKPREFIVAGLFLDKSMFAGMSGTLKLTRFDAEGAAGSFVIDGNEILMGSRPLHVEGTFDMPCRKELLQGACKSDKAEQP